MKTYLIPYNYSKSGRIITTYFIAFEPDTNEYVVLASASEIDFEYVQLDVCQTLPAAIQSIDLIVRAKKVWAVK